MRDQKFHEEDECARIIREEYERKEQEKIKQLEEEEKRKERVAELQRRRRQQKEEKAKPTPKPKVEPRTRAARAAAAPKATGGQKRSLPDYYGKGAGSKPSGIAGRTRKKEAVPSSYYKPDRNRRAGRREEEKEVAKKAKPAPTHKRPARGKPKEKSKSRDVIMEDPNMMNEIPPELLNQIYSEDLDQQDVMKFQNDEYSQGSEPPAALGSEPAPATGPQRLLDENMEVDYARPHREKIRRSPPPPDVRRDMPPPGGNTEAENDLLQAAIAESLKDNNPRQFPMCKYLVDFGQLN